MKYSWNQTINRANYINYWWGLVIVASITILLFVWLFYHWWIQPLWLTRLPNLLFEFIDLIEIGSIFTVAFVWSALIWRYWRRKQSFISALTVEELYALSPSAFEHYVAGIFRQKGYSVTVRGQSGDMGVDLEIKDKNNRKAIAQCKRYRQTIGPEIIRELYGTLIHERVHRAFLVTTADISVSAREWAKDKSLTLIDGSTLVEIATSLRHHNKKTKENSK